MRIKGFDRDLFSREVYFNISVLKFYIWFFRVKNKHIYKTNSWRKKLGWQFVDHPVYLRLFKKYVYIKKTRTGIALNELEFFPLFLFSRLKRFCFNRIDGMLSLHYFIKNNVKRLCMVFWCNLYHWYLCHIQRSTDHFQVGDVSTASKSLKCIWTKLRNF